MYLSILIAGFGGGAIRGLVGFIKHQYSYKNVKFDLSYFLAMIIVSGVVGLLVSVSVHELGFEMLGAFSPALGFVIGYAGGDFIENVYKIILKTPSLYSFSKKIKK